MPEYPTDLFQRFNVERGDWRASLPASAAASHSAGTSGKVHWVGSQAQMLRGDEGECFLLTMQFVDYILRGKRSFLRSRTQPYGPAGASGRLFTLSRNSSKRAKLKGAIRPQRAKSMGEDSWRRDWQTGKTVAESKAELEKAKWRTVGLTIEDTEPDADDHGELSGPAQDAFEQEYLQHHRYLRRRVVQTAAGDASALTGAVREVLSSPPVIVMVHVKPPYAHQMAIVGAVRGSGDFEFFDPNGGYCSFEQANAGADWFANGLVAQTEYAGCRIELHVYARSAR